MVTIHKRHELGELHALILRACPACIKDPINGNYRRAEPAEEHIAVKSTGVIAYMLKVSNTAVHHWIRRNRLPGHRARELVSLGEGRVTLADFEKFLH